MNTIDFAVQGVKEAYLNLFENYKDILYLFVYFHMGEELAVEIVEKIFIKVFEQFPFCKKPHHFPHHLYIFATEFCIKSSFSPREKILQSIKKLPDNHQFPLLIEYSLPEQKMKLISFLKISKEDLEQILAKAKNNFEKIFEKDNISETEEKYLSTLRFPDHGKSFIDNWSKNIITAKQHLAHYFFRITYTTFAILFLFSIFSLFTLHEILYCSAKIFLCYNLYPDCIYIFSQNHSPYQPKNGGEKLEKLEKVNSSKR